VTTSKTMKTETFKTGSRALTTTALSLSFRGH
jgi:hypothetical protein